MDNWAGPTLWACQRHMEMLIRYFHLKSQHPLLWHKTYLIKIRDPEQSSERKSRDINDWRSASRALSQPKQSLLLSSMDLFSFAWSIDWRLLWQCLLGRQFLVHWFIWARQFALTLRHSDKNALNHWQTLGCREGQWLNQHLGAARGKGGSRKHGVPVTENSQKSGLLFQVKTLENSWSGSQEHSNLRALHSFLHLQLNTGPLCKSSWSTLGWLLILPAVPAPRSFPWPPSFSLLGSGPILLKTLPPYHYYITITANCNCLFSYISSVRLLHGTNNIYLITDL